MIFFVLIIMHFIPIIYVAKRKCLITPSTIPKKSQILQIAKNSCPLLFTIYALLFIADIKGEIRGPLLEGNISALIPFVFQYIFVLFFVYACLRLLRHFGIDEKKLRLLKEQTAQERPTKSNIKNTKKHWFYSFSMMILSAWYYPIFMYSQNASELTVPQLGPILLLFASVGLLFFGVAWLMTKDVYLSGLCSGLLLLLSQHFVLIENGLHYMFPMVYYSHSVVLVFFIAAHLIYGMYHYFTLDIKEAIAQSYSITFFALTLINLLTALPHMRWTSAVDISLEQEVVSVAELSDLPNVYYFIYDEYADTETLEKYTGYDNSHFDIALENLGFTVSRTSINGADSSSTYVVVPKYLNLGLPEETVEKGNTPNYHLYTLMQTAGYELKGVGDSYFIHIPSETESQNLDGSTMEGFTFFQLFLQQTIVHPFFVSNMKDAEILRDNILNAFDYYKNPQIYKEPQPQFTALYLVTPHIPFLFDEFGQDTNPLFHNAVSESLFSTYYLKQYQYISSKILEQMEAILTHDPDCVIVLQSDHSARNLSGISDKEKERVLNAVYYQGEYLEEIEGETAINTLRFVVNKLFDTEYAMLRE